MVEYLLQTNRSGQIAAILQASETDIHTPALCDVEVVAALRRALLTRRLTAKRAGEAIEDYLDFPLSRHGHKALLARVLELRSNFSAYDAVYVALAERLKAELLTADEPLSRAVRSQLRLNLALA